MLKRSLHALYATLRDFAYGIDAANAIRHGLTPPADPRRSHSHSRHRSGG